jgi:hypothetical protein
MIFGSTKLLLGATETSFLDHTGNAHSRSETREALSFPPSGHNALTLPMSIIPSALFTCEPLGPGLDVAGIEGVTRGPDLRKDRVHAALGVLVHQIPVLLLLRLCGELRWQGDEGGSDSGCTPVSAFIRLTSRVSCSD